MGQLTYADLLDWLGMSNWQFILLTVLGMLAYAAFTTVRRTGGVGKVVAGRRLLPAFQGIYISYAGSDQGVGVVYKQAVEDFQMVFKFSNYFGMFYEPQGTEMKAVLGVAISKLEEAKVGLFLSKFPMYRSCTFPETRVIATTYPLINGASSNLATRQVYPVLEELAGRKAAPMMEIYHVQSTNPTMDVILPTQNLQSFDLWYQPSDYSRVFKEKKQ